METRCFTVVRKLGLVMAKASKIQQKTKFARNHLFSTGLCRVGDDCNYLHMFAASSCTFHLKNC